MASRGPKPKTAFLKLITGNPGNRPIATDIADEAPADVIDNGLLPPKKLKKRQQELWDTYIRKAHWLKDFDIPRAFMWVELHAEFERKPTQMIAGKIAQIRALGSELGLDPASRARLGAEADRGKKKDKAEQYF